MKELLTIVLHSGYSFDFTYDFKELMDDINGSCTHLWYPQQKVCIVTESVALIHPKKKEPTSSFSHE